MAEISRNLLAYKASMPRWFVVLLVAGGLLAGSSLYFLKFNNHQVKITEPNDSMQYSGRVGDQALLKKSALPPTTESNGADRTINEPPESQSVLKFIENYIVTKPIASFGIVFCCVSAAISALVLLISLPVFLFSSNVERVARAAGLVKTTIGFFVGSAGTMLATISF
jgi:hypothetical protein